METNSDLYTGPDGHVWKMILKDTATEKLVQSVGFTDKEINFFKSDLSNEVEARLQEAIGKVAT